MGIGNPLLGADGFGPAVLAALRARATLPPDVELLDAYTDLLGHIQLFEGFDHVVLIDAVLGEADEAVRVFDEDAFSQWTEESPSSHELSAMLAIGLFRRLYPQARTRISLVALEVNQLRSNTPVGQHLIDAGFASVLRVISA